MARRFCNQCKYNLRRLSSHICPECGNPFDPENEETFSKYGPNPLITFYKTFEAVILGIGIGAFVVFVLVVVLFFMLGGGWGV